MNKKFKKVMDEGMRMVLIMVKKRGWSNLSESLINVIVTVSVLYSCCCQNSFFVHYNISTSCSFKDIMASLIFHDSVTR